jgi:nicotinamide-nucleotide amidase
VPGKPVGTVWFGIRSKDYAHEEVCRFDGDRDRVRAQSVQHALELLLDAVLR